jgi:hypothetical protein
LKSYELEEFTWANKNQKKKGNMVKGQGHAADVDLMDLLFDVTIYMYADIVLER